MTIRTLSELFLVVAEHDKPDCLLHKVGRPLRRRSRPASWSAACARCRRRSTARRPARRPGRAHGRERPALADGRLRDALRSAPSWCRSTRPCCPTGAAYIARDSGAKVLFVQGARAPRGPPRRCAPRCPRSSTFVRDRRDERRRCPGVRDASSDVRRRAAPAPTDAEFERAGRAGEARRPRDVHLHQRHHRRPQGRDAHPRQPRLERRRRPPTSSGSRPDYTALSFLPLSHSFERTVDYIYFYRGVTIAYAESVQTVAAEPRARCSRTSSSRCRGSTRRSWRGSRRTRAAGSAHQAEDLPLGGRRRPRGAAVAAQAREPPGCWAQAAASPTSWSSARSASASAAASVFAVSGGAPLGRDVAEFFWGAGIPIYEGYGLTETSPVLVGQRAAARSSSARSGRPIAGVEVRIAADGEILAARAEHHAGLLRQARGDRRGDRRRRLVPHRRHRRARRRRLPARSPTARRS